MEFYLDERRKPREVTIVQAEPWPDEPNRPDVRLRIGAECAVKEMQFDPSDRTKPDPRHRYRVTVIFCLDPGGHCGAIVSFPHTTPIVVKDKPYPPLDIPIS